MAVVAVEKRARWERRWLCGREDAVRKTAAVSIGGEVKRGRGSMSDCFENARRKWARKKNLRRGGNLEMGELQEVMKVEDALVSLGQTLNIIQKEIEV